ncbi:ATP-binding cassette domain-containing protein [Candidatus Nomurabacteria bacterium]|nr:ATP-binding cassette domain-containing protein [Candidatus Nomurabacteria bacterium]
MSILLQISNLQKAYHQRPLFDGLSLSVENNQHIAVIGRNGAGKSTLFKIIMGEITPEDGEVQVYDKTRIGYIKQQEEDLDLSESVIDYLMEVSGKPSWECAKMAGTFDLKGDQLDRNIGSFSGGYHMRVKLLGMLLQDPNLLLLDEPTNYLDLSALLLLEQFLQNFRGSFLLISHDREFLRRSCDKTLEISRGKALYFPGPLETYLEHKATQEEFTRRYNKKIAREKRHLQSFVDRFRYQATKASQAQSKLKQIHKLKELEVQASLATASIVLPAVEQVKGEAMSITDGAIGYGESVIAKDVTFSVDRGEHIAIVGDNGQGKTTLLKTLAGAIPLLGGSMRMHHKISMGYYAQHVPDMLDPKDTVEGHLLRVGGGYLTDQQVYKMAGDFLFRDDDLKKTVAVLSGGEKARLSLAGLLLQKHDLLLLDEPTNHLDFETVDALAQALSQSNMTILFVSHDRAFVGKIASSVIEVEGGKVRRTYHDYDNYVYHLKKKLHVDEKGTFEVQNKEKSEKEMRRDLYQEIKDAKKSLLTCEREMSEAEKQKQELFAWFEKNATQYNAQKSKELEEVESAIAHLEKQWVELQGEIEGKEQELFALQA